MPDQTSASDITPEQALAYKGHRVATPFSCPYPDCAVFALHYWARVVQVIDSQRTFRSIAPDTEVWVAKCEHCNREVIFVDGKMMWPRASSAPAAAKDMPTDVRDDFDEARLIYRDSPRGAAALLRLALQKLCPHIGATEEGINEAIAELVAKGTVPPTVQQALDSVRVIGNEAVHPGELDLKDDEATAISLFKLLNFIVEKAITEPHEIQALYSSLPPRKLKGIEDRDAKSGAGETTQT
jgi:hypothetical protein